MAGSGSGRGWGDDPLESSPKAGRIEAPRVLLVEDNPADARLVVEALKDLDWPIDLSIVGNGDEALEFLNARGAFAGVATPDLVLLDLNLPGIDGFDVLEATKTDPDIRHIPILVMSTSSSDDDVRQSYRLQANGYISKPLGLTGVRNALETIFRFWFETARLPSRTTL